MNSTAKDRVKARYPQSIAQLARLGTDGGRWAIYAGPANTSLFRQVLGRGSTAGRAWVEASKRIEEETI